MESGGAIEDVEGRARGEREDVVGGAREDVAGGAEGGGKVGEEVT